ncbi:MAG TPA: nitrous oxide reductase family maturation protein NosD [Gemmatimonadales bacterium]|nr:nitrous oxide reductase family maturation protein NosD [Gemmatimonadales bacterium]
MTGTAVLALAVLATPARTLVVDQRAGTGAAFTTVGAALAAAAPGDTIRVGAGHYREQIVIDRRIMLLGDPGAVLDGGRTGVVITVTADSAVVAGFTVRASGRSLERDEAAIKLVRVRGVRITDNVIEDPLHGIYLLESHGAVVARNRITGATDLAEASRGNGIHLFASTGNQLDGNIIRATRDGIYFSFASDNRVVGNDVRGVRYGLHYMYSDDNQFERNVFARNAAGAAIMFSKRIVLRENRFVDHVGYRAYGILLQTAEQVVAERNQIVGNLTGVFLDGATGDLFRGNLITGNGIGVDLLASAEDNTFTENVITDNRIAVRKVLGSGENAWSADGRGNFWGDPAIFDLDGDGIGDRPYRVGDAFATLAATRPALDLFTGTLAARALAWAEDAFPVFDTPRVSDPHPLVRRPAAAPATFATRAVP